VLQNIFFVKQMCSTANRLFVAIGNQWCAEKAELVKLRYFAGLTLDEAAALLRISRTTANRYWSFSRAWLFNRLQDRSP